MTDDAPVIDAQTLKDMMAAVAQAVTVVTTTTPHGPSGLTVSAFTSVSASPPIVLICIDKVVSTLDDLLTSDGYTVNFLPEGTADVAMVFATHGADRFGTVPWHRSATDVGGPILDVAFGHFECRTVERVEMGDHWVIFAEVVAGGLTDIDAEPLLYLRRKFARAAHI
jgi:flavin reductase (DIM6/NTAB) family NADH-FMN oxidoreductase RutF